SLPRLGPEVREEVEKLLSPESLAIIAAVLGLWVGSHFIGIGEIIDLVLLAAGVFAIGLAVFDGVGELSQFASTALAASGDQDLDRAAMHFANAVSILGIQARPDRILTAYGTEIVLPIVPEAAGLFGGTLLVS